MSSMRSDPTGADMPGAADVTGQVAFDLARRVGGFGGVVLDRPFAV
jgi:hypothetical protein